MPEEALRLREAMSRARTVSLGSTAAYKGELAGAPCILVESGIGKVATATAAQALCAAGYRTGVLVLGIAGGITAEVHLGDVLVATHAVQHDLDARPFFPRSHVPHLGQSAFPSDERLRARCVEAARALTLGLVGARPGALGAEPPKVLEGLLLTGDQVIATRRRRETLSRDFPGALGVDMETAAVAQVCYQNGVPWAAVRIISDGLGDRINPARVLDYAATVATAFLRDVATRVLADAARV